MSAAASPPDRRRPEAAETPFDAPPWRFLSPGPCFRARALRYPAGFRPPSPVPSSRQKRQSPVVGPDDYPRPPEYAGLRLPHARRRHLPPRANRRPGNAPQWGGMERNINSTSKRRQGLFSDAIVARNRLPGLVSLRRQPEAAIREMQAGSVRLNRHAPLFFPEWISQFFG